MGLLNRGVDMKPLFVSPAIVTFTRGNKFFELSNHLGNVLATVSDRKLQAGGGTVGQWQGYYEAEVVTAGDYYPFGSIMPGRKYSAGIKYRYGFNGKEKDDESNGEGNSYDYGFRIYNPRIARFLSVDPLTKSYPWYTPYQFAGNTPIQAIDLDGLEEYIVTTKYSKNGDKTITIEVVTKRGTNEVVNLQYRIVLTRDKDGNITKTGDPLTGKKIVRIVERPDKKPEVSFANKLTQEEKEVLKDLEMEVHGPSSDQIWTINIEGKQYDAIVERDLTKYDEKVAEKTFPNNHKRIVKSTPYEPGQVLRDFDGDLNFIAASSVASGVSSPQGELGPVMLSSLEKIAKDLKKNNSIKSITINLRIGSSEGEGTSSYDNVKYAATAAIWNISNFLESKLKGI